MFDTLCPAIYKQLRLRAGLTQARLATALQTSRMTIMRFESGRARPEKEQEEKLKQLAGCSDVQFAELLCEQLSERIGRRVGLQEGAAYQATTALAAAYRLLERHSTRMCPEQIQALQEKISLTQFLELALKKCNTSLARHIRRCRDRLHQREQAC